MADNGELPGKSGPGRAAKGRRSLKGAAASRHVQEGRFTWIGGAKAVIRLEDSVMVTVSQG